MDRMRIATVLDPIDEYPHERDPMPEYNETMHLNGFDAYREVNGGLGLRCRSEYLDRVVARRPVEPGVG